MSTTLSLVETPLFRLDLLSGGDVLWRYRTPGGREVCLPAPAFEIDGRVVRALPESLAPAGEPLKLRNGCREYHVSGPLATDPSLRLEVVFRVAEDNPVVRFRYVLHGAGAHRLTKAEEHDRLEYLRVSCAGDRMTEVRFSEFNEFVHSYVLVEEDLHDRHFDDALRVIGPMLVGQGKGSAWLLAYEHGSQVPDAFVAFALSPDRQAALRAVKGNYFQNQPLDAAHPYATIWLECAAVDGGMQALADAYRAFVLHRMTLNAESRMPYIFYNTWAYQERNQAWNGHKYLDSMTRERMLAEIEVAHRMGIDVFVLDTGWYEKTGDWRVNLQRFPDGLRAVKEKLDGYGMKLGLWFSPTHAALTSAMHREHRDCIMSWRGTPGWIGPVWETEDSQGLCLVSRYADAFADELIRLVKEVGVTYFKWDAIGQYGCDDPGHDHGDAGASPDDRADCYAFRLGGAMAHVVDRLCAACPEAIVDFDVTEGGRSVGLGFLSAGKYFLINNGPYYDNYNIRGAVGNWSNIFVYPGPARGWVCRTPLTFDKWIPSVLFLTHYLPDDPAASQLINIASLILGQNGIWGDLLGISEDGVERFGRLLGLYKQVREDITESVPVFTGRPAGSPEIYEKISARGRGAVCVFTSAAGQYRYVTEHPVDRNIFATEGITVSCDAQGRAILECSLPRGGAGIVFFGVALE